MKKIIDDPATFVRDSLAAFAEVHSRIVRADLEHRLCLREPAAGRAGRARVRRGLRP
jgi:dihydroxyacetone kinase